MITIHALSILVLVLAVAVVLICAGLVHLQSRFTRAMGQVGKRLDALEAAPDRRPVE